MSVYFVKGKGWRYDFTYKGTRQTEAWFETKKAARQAENTRREELNNPAPQIREPVTPTDITFLELVNRRLDHVKAYNSERHYEEYRYLAKRWVTRWAKGSCSDITQETVEKFLLERRKISAFTANKELRYLRATFNHGKKKRLIDANPTDGIGFFPIEKRIKFVPSPEDIDKVISVADSETADYLWVLRETMARVSEINRLVWNDVNLTTKYVTVYTRKKRGGNFTPRHIPMTEKLYEVLSRRFAGRDRSKPWFSGTLGGM